MMRNQFRFYLLLLNIFFVNHSIIFASKTADSILVFNEVHYNPADDAKDSEWIELHNSMGLMLMFRGGELEVESILIFLRHRRRRSWFYSVAQDPKQSNLAGKNVLVLLQGH